MLTQPTHLTFEEIRVNGAYYTNEENILKVINPMFLEDLNEEFESVKSQPDELCTFHEKISNLKFLDPASGCGNFLIVTYLELIKLEAKIIEILIKNGLNCDFKVNLGQFYGIEIDPVACQNSKENMKAIDSQITEQYKAAFPDFARNRPNSESCIVAANALRIDWNEVVPKYELNYIIGNPPFVGYHLRTPEQREDMDLVFGKNFKRHGILDYVAAWFKKASDYMKGTKIEAAFVSTNSIAQGQQPAVLWVPLFENNNAEINFAYRPFKWTNEKNGKKAQVHCVIIGFSDYKNKKEKRIFYSKGNVNMAININPYLTDSENIFITSRAVPLCDVPEMRFGSMPRDGGNLSLTNEEKNEIIKENPISQKWIRPFIGAEEFLNSKRRWCLWLIKASPSELRKCKKIMARIQRTKNFRLSSKARSTRKFADTPTLFCQIAQPNENYILIPRTTSENRKYVPIGFMNKNVVASDAVQIIPKAALYHFGVLESVVHMAWVRAVAGRLKSDYRYSKDIVYNNFVWPNPTKSQKEAIEKAAQNVLDARKLYLGSTLADLYDPNTMPPELVKAHENLDNAVKAAYGDEGFESEEEIVASLMKLYKEALDKENAEKNIS